MNNKDSIHYQRWMGMRARCNNKNHSAYRNYGKRGIKVCGEWDDFSRFNKWCSKNYRPGLTLDRLDNDGPYSPENCRWVDRATQIENRRTTNRLLRSWFLGQQRMAKHWRDRRKKTLTLGEMLCNSCGQIKRLPEFYKKKLKNGPVYYSPCKDCSRKNMAVYYKKRKQAS